MTPTDTSGTPIRGRDRGLGAYQRLGQVGYGRVAEQFELNPVRIAKDKDRSVVLVDDW